MERTLSSSTTVIHRRVVPAVLALAWLVDVVIAAGFVMNTHQWAYGLIPVPTALIFWFIYRYLCAPFADRVVWSGDVLRVRKGQDETTILISQIEAIRSSLGSTPQRVFLDLREASILGKTIVFVPQTPKSLAQTTTESDDIRELRAKVGSV